MLPDFDSQYINAGKFKAAADWAIDYPGFDTSIDILERSGTIWCSSAMVFDLFILLRNSTNKYILITHASDELQDDLEITDQIFNLKPGCIKHWFGKNMSVEHPDVTNLPIGISNNVAALISSLPAPENKNIEKIFCAFRIFDPSPPLQDRYDCRDALSNHPDVEFNDEYVEVSKYIANIKTHLLIASPHGIRVDCYRFWEALYCNSIPIVTKHKLQDIFTVPSIKIDSWSSIDINELRDEAEKIHVDTTQLSMSYWLDKIEEVKGIL